MTNQKPILFQNIRLRWFRSWYRVEAEATDDARLKEAYKRLANLADEALFSISNGTQVLFMKKLELLEAENNRVNNEVTRLLSGKGADIPEWPRK